MSASQDPGNLLRLLEPHLGAPEIVIEGDRFATFYACLVGIKRDVVQLENQPVPNQGRACTQPPWGWGSNVVAFSGAKGRQP